MDEITTLNKAEFLEYLNAELKECDDYINFFTFHQNHESDIKSPGIEFIFRFDRIKTMVEEMIEILNNE